MSKESTMMAGQPNFEPDFSVDPVTGELGIIFTVNGNPAKAMRIVSPKAKQYAAYEWLRIDLRDAKSYLERCYELIPEPLQELTRKSLPTFPTYTYTKTPQTPEYVAARGLWSAAVIAYARCFVAAEGRRVKLERKIVPDVFRKTHDSVLNLRHSIVAHAGAHAFHSAATYVVFNPTESAGSICIYPAVVHLTSVDDRSYIYGFARLIDAIADHVMSKKKDLEEQIYSELSKEFQESVEKKASFGPHGRDTVV